MSTAAFTVLVAFPIAMILLAIANAVETSGRMIDGAQAVLDDGADVPFSEPHEGHVREAIALANDEPDPDFVARTRRVVDDELAQRRGAASS